MPSRSSDPASSPQSPASNRELPSGSHDSQPPGETERRALENTPWKWWRSQMPITKRWAYLDHAAVGPLSQPAAAAIHRFADQAAAQGDTAWPQWARRLEELRSAFSELIGAEADEICLLPNTTTGINLVAEGFPWKPGDSVVAPEGEFPSNLLPWLNQRHRGVEVRVVPRRARGEVAIDDLIDHVDGSTRIIAASWVGFASGYRLDVEALVERAHQRGVLVFLDAIQALGVYPLDVGQVPIDFLAADGHKWLLGPEGAGVGMIRREHLDLLHCPAVGWHSVESAGAFSAASLELRGDARRFEGGSANMIGMAALAESLDLFLQVRRQHGPTATGERVSQLAEQLDLRLREIGVSTRMPPSAAHRSGIVTFDVPGTDPAEVRRACLEQNVVLSVRDGGVRASIHAYNDDEDLRRLVEAVRSGGN